MTTLTERQGKRTAGLSGRGYAQPVRTDGDLLTGAVPVAIARP